MKTRLIRKFITVLCLPQLLFLALTFSENAFASESKQEAVVKRKAASAAAKTANDFQIDSKAIDEILSDVKPWGPGAFVTVSKNGKVLFQKGYGVENLKQKTPLSASTVFDLASCSKQFTAAAILLLCERGLISIDDPVNKYLPELKKEHQGYKGPQKLLVRHLLSMSSGLSDYSAAFDEDDFDKKTLKDVAVWTSNHKRKFAPGQNYDYNNGNYALLALIAERVTNQKFPDFMKQEFFDPLGMTHTQILIGPGQKIPHRAGGYKESSLGFNWTRMDTRIYGDGQIMTTPDDFALWDKSLYDCKLLKKSSLDLAFSDTKLANGKLSDYGFGWEISNRSGHKMLIHSGSWDGTSTFILRCPDNGLSVMVLSNNEDFGAEDTGEQIADLLMEKSR